MNKNHQSGFTMVEVLVAAIILMVSLLGMGALQSTAMKRNISSMNKTKAMEAMTYIGDAIRSQFSTRPSNQGIDASYNDIDADLWGNKKYQDYINLDCSNGCSRKAMTNFMLADWERMIGELPKGQGTVDLLIEDREVDGVNVSTAFYEVVIMWDDRQLAQNSDGSTNELGTGCSGNYKVDLACMKLVIRP